MSIRWRPIVQNVGMMCLLPACLGGFLWWRGFRATDTPSAVEASVARSVRNLAIPWSAHRAENPRRHSAQSVEDGRVAFAAWCASCHGSDGRGNTRLGRSLYPRVPDLTAPATQHLSDGDLHYIIENGVQLTGMPAWSKSHAGSDSWDLVSYLRSLDRPELVPVPGKATYVGSQACQKCHDAIYQRWRKTPMANVVRTLGEHPHAIIPDLSTNHVAPFARGQVALVYGQLWKQRYFTRRGNDYYPLSAQWEVGNHRWSRYFVKSGADWWASSYPPDNMQRPTGPTCDGCHSVGYNIDTHQVAEWNVGCERCHGPGSQHVEDPQGGHIVNPARLDAVASSDTCIQCHSQGRPLQERIQGRPYDWPVGYQVGLALKDFWKLETPVLGQTNFYHWPDGTAHKNRMQGNDFVQSVMYRRGVTCASCHDVHGTDNYAQLREPPQKLCLECHGPGSANGPHTPTLQAHTHHKPDSPGSQCVACHMPAVESEGPPGEFVHAHTFRVIPPAMTDRYGIPNACNTCHADKSTAWATQALRNWSGASPWRF